VLGISLGGACGIPNTEPHPKLGRKTIKPTKICVKARKKKVPDQRKVLIHRKETNSETNRRKVNHLIVKS